MFNVTEMLGRFDAAEAEFQVAAADFETARGIADQASAAYVNAELRFQAAARAYQWMLALVLISATWDMSSSICETVQSTASSRREFGIAPGSGLCVDHVFPHAAGGINQRWNYMAIDCALNSSLGDAVWTKLMAEPIPMLQGMAASALGRLRCGANPSAWKR